MIKTLLIIFVLLYMVSAHSQQTIDKLNANQLKLPKETVQKALSIDATGQVKSSSTSDTELGYLSGTTSNVQDQIDDKANDTDAVHLTGNESISGIKTFTGRLETSSTINASLPCPVMTQAQRDLIASPVVGDCVYNNDTDQSNIYDGSIWKSMGGSGGISLWLTATGYAVDDVVIESNKIYICLEAHTSGTFATDLAASKWLRVSTDVSGSTGVLPLTNGGLNKALTASDGAIAYSDSDSLELLAPGTSGQILQTNGASAPSFVNKSISAKAENGSSVTLEEIQAPNNQLTTTATNKYLLNDCGSSNNLLANCGFEHSTPATSWTLTNGSSAVETSNVKQGKQALKLTLSAQALNFKQTSTLNALAFADGVNGSISISVKTTVDNVYLCRTDSAGAVVASTDGTKITDCVKAPNTGKWSDLVMPIILGATQNGLALVSLTPSTAAAVAVTGDVYVDAGSLEAGVKTQVVNNVGPWTSFTPTGSWTTNTTYTGKYRQVGENLEVQYFLLFSGTPNAATLTLNTPSGFTIDIGKILSSSPYNTFYGEGVAFDAGNAFYAISALYNDSTSLNIQRHSSSSGTNPVGTNFNSNVSQAVPFTFSTGDSVAITVKFPVTQFSGSSSVYTASCGANCVDTFSAKVSNTGVVSGENANWIEGNCSVSTSDFTCTHVSGIFTVEPNCVVMPDLVGDAATTKLAASSSAVTSYRTTVSGASTAQATEIICQKQGADFVASRTIVGSFAEVVTSQGTTSPDIQSVYFGSGSNCESACTTGSCSICSRMGTKITSVSFSATGTYDINGLDSTKYICTGSAYSGLLGLSPLTLIASGNSSKVVVTYRPGNSSTSTNASHSNLICSGAK